MTQRDGMGREEGVGFGMGNICTPVADSFDIWQNQYNIVKLNTIKKNKSRDITLPTKVRLVNPMVFPVVMYGCESWNVKKAEC